MTAVTPGSVHAGADGMPVGMAPAVPMLRPLRTRCALVLVLVIAAAGFFVATDGWSGARAVVIGIVVGVGLLYDVQLPQGGTVPAGHAFVMAAAYALPLDEYALVAALGLLLAYPRLFARLGPAAGPIRLLWLMAGAVAAGAVAAAYKTVPADPHATRVAFFGLLVAGVAYLVVDLVRLLLEAPAARRRTAAVEASPVFVTVLCTGALLGMAYREGWWMVLFATLPLLITRYSFQRYSTARETYGQTIQALGIVPELAGHAPLGHGERSAAYVDALGDALALPEPERDRLRTAARLHHIGHIGLPECDAGQDGPDALAVGRAGADILRETGFLAEVADLVHEVGAPGDGGEQQVEPAIVRVATAFDELVGEDAGRAAGAVAILAARHHDEPGRQVIDALRRLLAGDPGFVDRAIEQGAPLTRAAAAANATA